MEHVTTILLHTVDSQFVAMQYVRYCLQCWRPVDILDNANILGNAELNDK